ncbi:unnamed protein product [Sordaria macrospora k-hell]|uniref:WGS project CABT00000000 data, contig 2.69 n=2 Tax=Sordaria macrospora TaxID=5147 RepID=F7WB27_SORMK|nr:uncharacterized protein SMAC_08908 [Sordaria macrospora k-hell]KAH7635565.1 hypothetical protein B0T09DRAFT_390134 [Sordaria sp. MPI-SDFR-AT-0083]CCC14319.1 unnamed protein product [Sordaria macrospora k-hell]
MAPSMISSSILRKQPTSRTSLFAFLCLTLFSPTAFALNFSIECRDRVYSIINGAGDPYGNLTEQDLYQNKWIYEGHVQNLDDTIRYNRSAYIAITLEGCKNLCHSPIEWYLTQSPPTQSFNIAANWILPILALVACLPFDSLHRRAPGSRWHNGRLPTTLKAILNWLGSPPTSLTATLWNVYQIRQCKYYTFSNGGSHEQANRRLEYPKATSYYILSCINQFELPTEPQEKGEFVETLVYGILKPLEHHHPNGQGHGQIAQEAARQAVLYTTELREALAFQLRMYRRRGTYPAGINICVFLGAFAISIGLAFADDLGEYTTAHSLALGLLEQASRVKPFRKILSSNANKATNRVLIQRWLWNVEAVKLWEEAKRKGQLPNPEAQIDWWNPAKQRRRSQQERFSNIRQPNETIRVASTFRIGDFIGQGRKMGYHGLTSSVLSSVYDDRGNRNSIPAIAASTTRHLSSTFHRPFAWWLCALISLSLVWLEINMALLVSYMTPTVGLSCRSGAYLCYGVLTTITWFVSCFFKNPNQAVRIFCHFFNALAVGVLGFIVFAQFTGVLNNCACKCGVGGYMSFQDAAFYGKYFQVRKYWLIGALVGGLPPVVCFVVSGVWLGKLKVLWQASEQMEVSWELTEWRAEMGTPAAATGTGPGPGPGAEAGQGAGPGYDEQTRIEADMSWLT